MATTLAHVPVRPMGGRNAAGGGATETAAHRLSSSSNGSGGEESSSHASNNSLLALDDSVSARATAAGHHHGLSSGSASSSLSCSSSLRAVRPPPSTVGDASSGAATMASSSSSLSAGTAASGPPAAVSSSSSSSSALAGDNSVSNTATSDTASSATQRTIPAAASTASTTHAPATQPAAAPVSAAASPAAAAAVVPLAAKKSEPISYAAQRVIGTGSFGVVYEARVLETGETVAIKKVLQDRRFKNRELAIMSQLQHSNVIRLRHCFYSRDPKPGAGPCAPAGTSSAHDELHLNLVMEFVHTTLHRTLREHTKSARLMPLYLVRLYMWQLLRATHYIHSLGICHRDIKPQNVLLTRGHELRLCDFGSAKVLVRGEPNVSYICSRYYRAPELVWEATSYSTQIDAWSVGAVMGEMLLSAPLFPGESSVDQMISIIRVLGSPSPQEVRAMNPSPSSAAFQFPSIPRADFAALFKHRAPPDALELVQALLRYDPTQRVTPLQALQFRFFDPLPFRDTHVMDEVPPGAIAAYVAQQQAMAKAAAAAAAAAATTNNATAAVAANTHATTVNGRDAHPRAN